MPGGCEGELQGDRFRDCWDHMGRDQVDVVAVQVNLVKFTADEAGQVWGEAGPSSLRSA
jgi:hypothetical protein